MTDTRFHPVEVTTMFVSRRYAGTQATFPSRFPVKLMAATSWGPPGWLRAHGTLKTAHLLGTSPDFSRDYYERAMAGREEIVEEKEQREKGEVGWRRHLLLVHQAPRDGCIGETKGELGGPREATKQKKREDRCSGINQD